MDSNIIAVPRNSCPHCGKFCFLPIHFQKHEGPPISLKNSNRVPDADEEMGIWKSVKGAEDEIALLDVETNHLRDMMARLEARRNEAIAYIGRQRTVLSPVRRIPMDILAEIFRVYVESQGGLHIWKRPVNASLWVLAAVCKTWRIAAFSTPTLWSKLIVDPNEICKELALERLQSCLKLSTETLLSLSLVLNLSNHEDIWNTLLSESHRWEKVLAITSVDQTDTLTLTKHHFPKLQVLRLVNLYYNPTNHLIDTFQDCPELRTVCITQGHIRSWRLPWTQLHHLSFSYMCFQSNELFTLLAQIPKLTSFCWEDGFTPDFDGSLHIALPRLRKLVLRRTVVFHHQSSKLQTILNAISAPQLTMLYFIDHHHLEHPSLVDSILQFCDRSSCNLASLDVGDLETASAHKLFTAKGTSLVKELNISLQSQGALLSLLYSHGGDDRSLLPRLQQLQIDTHMCGGPDTMVMQLVHVLDKLSLRQLHISIITRGVSEQTYNLVAQFNANMTNKNRLELIKI